MSGRSASFDAAIEGSTKNPSGKDRATSSDTSLESGIVTRDEERVAERLVHLDMTVSYEQVAKQSNVCTARK